MPRLLTALLATSLLLPLHLAAQAGTISLDDTSAPSTNLLLSQPSQDSTNFTNAVRLQIREAGAKHGEPGQTFTTTDNWSLDKITLRLFNGIATEHVGETVFVDILEIDDSDGTTVLSNLGTTTFTMPSTTTWDWITFDINDTTLDASKMYAFRVGLDAAIQPGITDFRGSNNIATYSGGGYFGTNNTGTPTVGTTAQFDTGDQGDLEFYLTGTTVIPEPATVGALSGLVGLAFAIRRKRSVTV
ncbi:MAG: PEP-CTERM sorting domain-containing protein [Opitutales bacterium]